ncbi:class I SAM-dependent methyltransferase [Ornithinibacillus bavariensis]|uniref:Methyltransferase n=1 Tax=Ornithinibacillus bavariensis TaxID=545502 RepID=A0A919X8G8_9BACI|nr:class I SAM-dependent methyltransferase [Ornithinibacillus bavariensis]GIO26783.1 methyltransferase [Ornithinibacillus bavariensis]HAM80768.1 SAM-dependent methyltransferase [Ornithinibacillus sp.]
MDIIKQNSIAWDQKVEDGATYTKPVAKEIIEKSKTGDWEITVTTVRKVPRGWFPDSIKGLKILCLASGGGQQGPVLAAAGADVTVVDMSLKQLEQDKYVATRDGLNITTIQGNMKDLHFLEEDTYDMIIHPVSNVFVDDVLPVWKEAARVLKEGGILIAGFTNPLLYIFDDEAEMKGKLEVKHKIPYSDLEALSKEKLEEFRKNKQTFEFGHTLEDQIQGQIDAGFVITGFYEDDFGGTRLLDNHIKTFIATRALKK